MRQHTRTTLALAAVATLGACGGGGGGVAPQWSASADGALLDACEASGARALAGDYAGTITYDATARGGAMCEWTARARIDATSRSGAFCELSMVLDASVDQLVVPADGAPFSAACIASEGVSAVLDLTDAGLSVSADALAPEAVPYPGTEGGPLVRSLSLVSTLVPLVDAFAVDASSGALAPVRLRPIESEVLAGELVRVDAR